MSSGTAAHRFVRLLSLGLVFVSLASSARADDQNQRRRQQRQQQRQEQQQQQPQQQQPPQRMRRFEQQNVFPQQQQFPRQQQEPVRQPRIAPFQPPQPRTVVNPNAPAYQPPIGNPNVQGVRPFVNPNADGTRPIVNPNAPVRLPRNPNKQNQLRPDLGGQEPYRQDRPFPPGTTPGRMPVTPLPTTPGRVVPVTGIQNDNGQGTLRRRDVLSSPEDHDFVRGLSAQQRRQLDQLSPEQIQSLQQSGQWAATKQAILAGRSPITTTQNGAVANPNGSGSITAPPPPTPGGNTGTANTLTGNTARSSSPPPSMSPNDAGPTSGADPASALPNGDAVQAPTAPPPQAPPTLQISGFPPSFSASGGGSYQPAIPLSGSGFTTMTQIVWTCAMPNGQPCTGQPYTWTPSSWAGKYTPNGDTSATVAPHLLAGGDPVGIYQWTVSFVGNGGKSFVFQVNNAGSVAPPPPSPPSPPPPVAPPAPPPVSNNPPVSAPTTPPSSQVLYFESGTGTQLTADQIRSGSFPPGTFFIESGTGRKVTQADLQGGTPPQQNPLPPQQSAPVYTFNALSNGNVEIYQNGQRVSTGSAQYAAQYGYRGPGWDGQVASNPPSPTPQPPPPVQPPSTPPPAAVLRVSGIPSLISWNGGQLRPTFTLTGAGLSSITQIVWQCTMPSGQPCTDSPYVWTPQTWGGKFFPQTDASAAALPMLLAGGDPPGTYQWTASFYGGGQTAMIAFQVVNTTPVSQPPPVQPPPTWQPSGPISSIPPTWPPEPPFGGTQTTTPMTLTAGQQLAVTPQQLAALNNWVHAGLNGISLIPGPIGNVASGANAILYLSQNDLKNAGISAIGAIPVLGLVRDGSIVALVADDAGRFASREFKLTETVAANAGQRPYVNSDMFIRLVMNSTQGIRDTGGLAGPGVPGALKYTVLGEFTYDSTRNSFGTYELVIDPETKIIYHFLFKSQ